MSRNVFVLTKCDGSPQRVIASKDWADSILEDDLEACGVKEHRHQMIELELEYDKSQDLREWLSDNFSAVKDSVDDECAKWCDENKIPKYAPNDFSGVDTVDVDNLANSISESLKAGLLNVLDTYESSKGE